MNFFKILLVIIYSLYLVSCGNQQKSFYNYLENMRDTTLKEEVILKEPIIQKNDLMSILIFSASLDPKVDAAYNIPIQPSGGDINLQNGFLVDVSGNIEYPRLGTLHVEGLTKSEMANLMKTKLAGQLTDPLVLIRFMNFRITIMGEVGSPGMKIIPSEKLTILEALGMSGDITEFGKKKSVRVLRENNSIREIGTIDLTSKEIFKSPYYQLQQNDVVLVEQTRFKMRQRDQQRVTQQLGFTLSMIGTVALLISIFK